MRQSYIDVESMIGPLYGNDGEMWRIGSL
jgi:hypothetical protein